MGLVTGVAAAIVAAVAILRSPPPELHPATPSPSLASDGGDGGPDLASIGPERTAVRPATEDNALLQTEAVEEPEWTQPAVVARPVLEGSEEVVFDDGDERGVLVRPGFVRVIDFEGQLVAEGPWEGGEKHGHWKYFENEGALSLEGGYVAGVENGEWTGYLLDGSISRHVNLREGKFHGQCMFYVPFANESDETRYLSGLYEDGVLIEQY